MDKYHLSLLSSILLTMLVMLSCRTIKSVSGPKAQNRVENPFCDPLAQKSLICSVRDVVPRSGSQKNEVARSPLAMMSKATMVIFPADQDRSPLIEFMTDGNDQESVRFENTNDLYQRDGCLVGIQGGIFSEGFTPRASIKVIISAKNTDHAVFAEVSDYRYNNPIHFTMDLQCERRVDL